MANCSVCGAATSSVKSPTYPAAEFRKLVANGFRPQASSLKAAALTEQAWLEKVAQSEQDYILCAECVEPRRPLPAETAQRPELAALRGGGRRFCARGAGRDRHPARPQGAGPLAAPPGGGGGLFHLGRPVRRMAACWQPAAPTTASPCGI